MKRFLKFLLLLVLLVLLGNLLLNSILPRAQVLKLAAIEIPDWIDRQIIGVDGDSRRGIPLEDIRDIVIHYVGNPGTTAQQNRGLLRESGIRSQLPFYRRSGRRDHPVHSAV